MALNRVSIPSPNYSSRGGAGVRLVVLHTAQGARTARELGAFFARSSSGVSSHVGIDDALGAGTIAQYVPRSQKAWTQGNANPVAVSAELCAFAEWGSAEWDRHPVMLANTAAWIAEECAALGIPITKLTAQQAQGSGRGVCQHVDLGSWGGGHWDCGPAFPIDRVLEMARGGAAPAPGPEDDDMLLVQNPNNNGWCLLAADGTYRGISSPDVLNWYESAGVRKAPKPTPAVFAKFRQAGTI